MLNILWPIFIILSFSYAIFMGNVEELNTAIFESTSEAIKLSITLLGTLCMWNGIMKIAMRTKLIDKIIIDDDKITIKYKFNNLEL